MKETSINSHNQLLNWLFWWIYELCQLTYLYLLHMALEDGVTEDGRKMEVRWKKNLDLGYDGILFFSASTTSCYEHFYRSARLCSLLLPLSRLFHALRFSSHPHKHHRKQNLNPCNQINTNNSRQNKYVL